jgi:hypothetical protein
VATAALCGRYADVNVAAMYALARLLQIAGLTIPLVAIFAQLSDSITPGKLLGFLVVSVLLFSMGYLLQSYTGGGRK